MCVGPKPSGGESIPVEARGGEPKINLPIRLPTFAEGFRPDPGGIGLLIDPIPELWDRISIVFGKDVPQEETTEDVGATQTVPRGKTQWGWVNSPAWKRAAKEMDEPGTHRTIGGKIPTIQEAIDMIQSNGGRVECVDSAHPEGGVSTHTYPHINYYTSQDAKATVEVRD
jgi:hypothetical protein